MRRHTSCALCFAFALGIMTKTSILQNVRHSKALDTLRKTIDKNLFNPTFLGANWARVLNR
ncbi:hypothetical protein ACPOL_0965 [Acidisarcina polymorpha]|uniref:Uncharacterized protein n=1 Tax=Acidisarcina polymorpha TaxID=2211140 RepID=A0A2Z5FV77_9BACT|nr:hypothetical protein ACPOL_0965 [Acidisarcina polymorpha]